MKSARFSFALVCGTAGAVCGLLTAAPSGAASVGLASSGLTSSGLASSGLASSGLGPAGLAVGRPAPLPPGAIDRGALAGPTPMRLEVTLRVPDQAALTAFLAGLSNRRSPDFDHFLRPGQFAARFGATSAEIEAVTSALRAAGLDPGPVAANRLSIPVTGTAAAVDRALNVGLTRYGLAGGRTAFANARAPSVPTAAVPYVQGVLGLSDVYHPRSLAIRPLSRAPVRAGARARLRRLGAAATASAAGPQPCAAATDTAGSQGTYTADQLAGYYEMPPLYGMGDLGQGVHIALAEFEPDSPGDISAYESCYGLSTPVSYTEVDGGAGTGSGSGEAALDIEDVMGLAPDATIDVYQEPNNGTDTATYDLYSAIVTADKDQVVSTSWGLCELDSDSSLLQSEQTVFEQAATQGQTVFAAAGDDGSTDCYGDPGTTHGTDLAVDDPGSQPYVLSVGGTSISSESENVWNDSGIQNGAGGGGVSAAWCMPAYQQQTSIPGLVSTESQTSTSCTSVPYVRQVPDVSADADPQTGYVIYYDGSWTSYGGTSAAAPLWAAVAALIDASPFCADYGSGDAGVRPAGLYAVAAAAHSYIYGESSVPEALYDVTSGNNDYTPSGYTGGLYSATTGYDMASGLGTPLVSGLNGNGTASNYYPGLAAFMCAAYATKLVTTTITSVSPSQGPSGRAETITITGTGYLPVAGADVIEVGSDRLTASCSSTTRCTVRLPGMRTGTVTLRMSVEDLTLSPVTSHAHYQVVAAPSVRSLSPASGSRRGGNRLTIHGSNFIGVRSVLFGKKKGTRIRVVSATEIQVTAPAGSGTVEVTISAAGGTSKATKSTRYRYR
jgi:subtilase family serine protease